MRLFVLRFLFQLIANIIEVIKLGVNNAMGETPRLSKLSFSFPPLIHFYAVAWSSFPENLVGKGYVYTKTNSSFQAIVQFHSTMKRNLLMK